MSQEESALHFQLALTYYKQENVYAKVHYKVNVRLVALSKQATCGSYETAKPEEPGLFDVVGKDRKAAWKALGEMSKTEAEQLFCKELAESVPVFNDWLQDRLREKKEREERERLEKERLEKERLERERLEKERQEREKQERERQERERLERERQLRIQQQEQERVRLERERLAQQQHVLQQQQQQQQQQQGVGVGNGQSIIAQRSMSDPNLPSLSDTLNGGAGASAPASLQKPPGAGSKNSIDAAEFRNGLRGSADNELVVGRGEIVTVRVPKPSGKTTTRVLWQFSTVDYDIGFGLDFERVNSDGTAVLDPILPVMRVNAQNQVVEGRHETSSEGAWLLKFDNSYSYLRSKTVYYRILFQTQ